MEISCAIYVYAAVPFDDLLRRIAEILDGEIGHRTVEGSGLVVDVLKNDEFDENVAAGGAGDFVYFPYKLDVEADPEEDEPVAYQAIADLLARLKLDGFDFVTAADFEAALPDMGRSRPGPLPTNRGG